LQKIKAFSELELLSASRISTSHYSANAVHAS